MRFDVRRATSPRTSFGEVASRVWSFFFIVSHRLRSNPFFASGRRAQRRVRRGRDRGRRTSASFAGAPPPDDSPCACIARAGATTATRREEEEEEEAVEEEEAEDRPPGAGARQRARAAPAAATQVDVMTFAVAFACGGWRARARRPAARREGAASAAVATRRTRLATKKEEGRTSRYRGAVDVDSSRRASCFNTYQSIYATASVDRRFSPLNLYDRPLFDRVHRSTDPKPENVPGFGLFVEVKKGIGIILAGAREIFSSDETFRMSWQQAGTNLASNNLKKKISRAAYEQTV